MRAPRGARLSQTIPYANIRTALDRSAGRIHMLARQTQSP